MAKKTIAEINLFLNKIETETKTFLEEAPEKQKTQVISALAAQIFALGFTMAAGKGCSCNSDTKVKNALEKMPEKTAKVVKKPITLDPFGFAEGTTAAKINKLISSKPRSKEFLAKKTGVSVSAVTGHLQNLKKKEINLQVEKRGVTAYYSLEAPVIETEGTENE